MSESTESPSWFNKLGQWLLREPKDREQLISLLRDAEESNLINADSLSMLEGTLQVSEMQVRDIMIPKAQMIYIKLSQSIEEAMPTIVESAHSRFPVVSEDLENVRGILHAKDLLISHANLKNVKIEEILRPQMVVPESIRLDALLKKFRKNKSHMAIVINEFGHTSGLVTMEDVLELIVGDIEDEFDVEDEQNIRQHSPSKFIIKALTPIEDFNEYFRSNINDDEFDTIGGYVTHQFGHLPVKGEKISIAEFSFKVLHADKRKLLLLQVNIRES